MKYNYYNFIFKYKNFQMSIKDKSFETEIQNILGSSET